MATCGFDNDGLFNGNLDDVLQVLLLDGCRRSSPEQGSTDNLGAGKPRLRAVRIPVYFNGDCEGRDLSVLKVDFSRYSPDLITVEAR